MVVIRKWHYLNNQFDEATEESNKKMDTLGTDHYSSIEAHKGDPFFDELIAFFYPFLLKFNNKYAEWVSTRGKYHGRTLFLEAMLEELSKERAPKWSGLVQAFYHKNTPQYQSIFNDGLVVFSRSTYEGRFTAVKALIYNLKDYPELANVMAEVQTFYDTLIKTRNEQQNYEEHLSTVSEYVKDARKELADAMYRNLAMLMAHHYKTPEKVAKFFQLDLVQEDTKFEEEPLIALNPDGSVMKV